MDRHDQNLSLLPSDNASGVPSLIGSGACEIPTPVIPWGSVARGTANPGTWVFYVDDYRFSALLRDPLQLTATGCKAAVEPNTTLFEQTPRYEVLAAVGRKRRAARLWQEAGVLVFVDLNVPERWAEDCLLGVPRGWRAFATRGYANRQADLVREHAIAAYAAGGRPLLLVYGGGREIEGLCRSLPGAAYVPDFAQKRRTR